MYTDEQLKEALANARASGDDEAVRLITKELSKRASNTPAGMAKDAALSAASGAGTAVRDLLVGGLAAKAGIDPKLATQQADKYLPSYKPQTELGEYARNIGIGAVAPNLPTAAAGIAGGALAKFAEKQGYDSPVVQLLAWMAPNLLTGAIQAMKPGGGPAEARRILAEVPESEKAAALKMMDEAKARGVNMGIWQGAPTSSPLYETGARIASHPAGSAIRETLASQVGKGGQQWVDKVAGPPMESLSGAVVGRQVPYEIRAKIAQLVANRNLSPGTPDYNAARRAYEMFRPPFRAPGDPPPVWKVGELMSKKQAVGNPNFAEFQGASEALRGGIRQAIDEALSGVPGYNQTLDFYGNTKKLAEIMARDAPLRAGGSGPGIRFEAREAGIPTSVRASATNVRWALVPKITEITEAAIARQLAQALNTKDFKALEALAAKHPQLEGLITALTQGVKAGAAIETPDIEKMVDEYFNKR